MQGIEMAPSTQKNQDDLIQAINTWLTQETSRDTLSQQLGVDQSWVEQFELVVQRYQLQIATVSSSQVSLVPLAVNDEVGGGNVDGKILTRLRKIKPGAIKKAINRIREMRAAVANNFGAAPEAMALDAARGNNKTVAGIPIGLGI